MKYIFFLLVIFSFGFKPLDKGAVKATLTTFHTEKCGCCWGWGIEIDGKEYISDKLPNIPVAHHDTITYPKTIYIEYTQDVKGCPNMITVSNLSYD